MNTSFPIALLEMALATIEGANPTTRLYTFIASTGIEDRNHNIYDVAGWDLENYKKNPVVLGNHDWLAPPIGKAHKIWTEQDRLMVTLSFASTPRAKEYQTLVDEDIIRSISAGSLPLQAEPRRNKDGWPIGVHSHRHELVEISLTSTPANPETLRTASLQVNDPSVALLIQAIRDQAGY